MSMSNIKKVNEKIFNSYLNYLKSNYKLQTQISYASKIKIFISYLNENQIYINKFNFNDILDFSFKILLTYSDSTRYASIAGIKNLVYFLNLKNINNLIKVDQIKLPKKKSNEVRIYSNEEIKLMFELSKNNLELKIMLILGLFYFFTTNELTIIKKPHIDVKNSTIWHFKRGNIKIHEKHMSLIKKLILKSETKNYLFSVRSKSGLKTIFNNYIITKSNIKNVEFKRLNNMCIFNYFRNGLLPIEVSIYLKITIQTANKMYNEYLAKEFKIKYVS